MKKILFVASLALSSLFAGAPASAKPTASCDHPKASLCDEPASTNGFEAFCKNTHGTFASTPCPREGVVGSCANSSGTKLFYSSGGHPFTAESAQKYCTENMAGKFTAAK